MKLLVQPQHVEIIIQQQYMVTKYTFMEVMMVTNGWMTYMFLIHLH